MTTTPGADSAGRSEEHHVPSTQLRRPSRLRPVALRRRTRSSPALPAVPPLGSRRAPWIAALLSAFPGLGSVYNGSYARGVAFFLSVVGCMHMADRGGSDLWGFGIAFVWLFNIIDAYREARLIRAGLASDVAAERQRPATSPVEGIGLGRAALLGRPGGDARRARLRRRLGVRPVAGQS